MAESEKVNPAKINLWGSCGICYGCLHKDECLHHLACYGFILTEEELALSWEEQKAKAKEMWREAKEVWREIGVALPMMAVFEDCPNGQFERNWNVPSAISIFKEGKMKRYEPYIHLKP